MEVKLKILGSESEIQAWLKECKINNGQPHYVNNVDLRGISNQIIEQLEKQICNYLENKARGYEDVS